MISPQAPSCTLRRPVRIRLSLPKTSATFALQAMIIVGGVVRLLPLTGQTLPFVSYGGSSLLANFLIVGLLLVISQASAREARRA